MTKDKSINVRSLALEVLIDVLENGVYSSEAIHTMLQVYQYLDKKDRAFLTRLCEGTIERTIELDYILNQYSNIKTDKMKPVIRNILRMAVYQIKYMTQVPHRAACNEAVKLAARRGFSSLKGFVNGVLRTISRDLEIIEYPKKEKDPIFYLSICYSMPKWLISNWVERYGLEVTEQIAGDFLEEKKTTIRCNTMLITPQQLKQELEKEQIIVEDGIYFPYEMRISSYDYIRKIKAFQEGKFSIQDAASMCVASAAGIKEGDHILDLCAAPGGKSLHAAELLRGSGLVISRDITEQKVALIKENAKRLHINNIQIECRDALEEDIQKKEWADIVIADVPCSGLGVIGKKTDIKYKTTKQQQQQLAAMQRELLKQAANYVKQNGILMYSTCTFGSIENEENIRWFISEYPFVLESMESCLPEPFLSIPTVKEGYIELLPGIQKTDGFFIAKLRKIDHLKIMERVWLSE